jgi:thioredoxin-related protein
MKKIKYNKLNLALLLLFVFSTPLLAQNWQDSFDQSKELAAKENKPLILVFSGSDWCAPCMKLEHEIWNSEAFKLYASKNYILYKADFPRKKKNKLDEKLVSQNEQLAEKYNTKGYFPHVVILDSSGKIVGQTGYKKLSPEEYIKHLNSFLNK